MPKDFFTQLSDHKTPPTYNFFNGEKWVSSRSCENIDVRSPIDDHVIGRIQKVTHSEIDQVINHARKAQILWSEIPMIKRGKILHLAADWIRQHEHYLTVLLMKEIGKTHTEAKDEILRS